MRVLLIDIDSLRPDHLGCYGYGRNTSPTIDSVATEGVRFEECYVSDSPCLPSRTALATCRFGIKTGVVTHFGEGQYYDNPGDGHAPDPQRAMSFRQLLEGGIHTTTITSFSQRHLAYHFTGGFQEHIQPSEMTGDIANEDATKVTGAARTWLDQHATEDNWLLHVNYWDVHHPYEGIAEYVDEMRASGSGPSWPNQAAIDDQQGTTGPRTADCWPTASAHGTEAFETLRSEWPFPKEISEQSDVEHLRTGYDAAIRKVDSHVATLLDELDRHGVREDTAIVVTGDHGEAFGEHGIYAEHAFPHRACQRVPLIVSWPTVTDQARGRVVDGFVHQFDLMPTICELFEVDIPQAWDATPFTPALFGEEFAGREYVVSGHGIYTWGRSLYTDDWIYTRLLHPGAFSAPGLYNDPELSGRGLELLHDRSVLVPEADNVAGENPEVTRELRHRLAEWTRQMVETGPKDAGGVDPLARMAAREGPFLYYDPEALLDLYRRTDRTPKQIDTVENARRFPMSSADD